MVESLSVSIRRDSPFTLLASSAAMQMLTIPRMLLFGVDSRCNQDLARFLRVGVCSFCVHACFFFIESRFLHDSVVHDDRLGGHALQGFELPNHKIHVPASSAAISIWLRPTVLVTQHRF